MPLNINYPFLIDGRGRVATAESDAHIRQMMEQVLFTGPGERVNRPDFGSGIQQYLFAPNSSELDSAAQVLVKSALEQWLGELIQLEAVEVDTFDSQLRITIQYLIRRNQQRQVTEFTREI
jgi:phage baseplate assembly protein W